MSRATRTLVRDLPSRAGERVTACGWVQALRLQKQVQFVILRDHTGQVQLVHRRGSALDQVIDSLTPESAVIAHGTVVADPRVLLGGLEVRVDALQCVAPGVAPLPVDEHSSADRWLDHPDLRWRRAGAQQIVQTKTRVLHAIRSFCVAEGLRELQSPKLTAAASESGAELFTVDYFGRAAYLAQSPQLYKQLAIAGGWDGVFETGPVFRAEPSHTTRHATEFTGVDVELAWTASVEDIMVFQERMLAAALGAETPFYRITMAEARELLRSSGVWSPSATDDGTLDPAGERALGELVAHDFVFVTEFPAAARPFYHHRHRPGVSASFDLLYRGLEITTGSQREHRYDVLLAQLLEAGGDPHPLRHYLQVFRHGCPPHGGFGMGLERLVMSMLGLATIRDACFVFRGPNRLHP